VIITSQIEIPDDELHLAFVRGSGPGGQNVNKVATAVQLRFDAAHSPSLPDDVRERLLRIGGSRVTDDGVLVIEARRARTQLENRNLALAQFAALVRKAAVSPRKRRKTAPTTASIERRLRRKKRRSEVKRDRRLRPGDDA
jgi:ribosome-associated protein